MASPVTGTTSPLANPLAIHIPSLDNTYGALLLGTFFGLILYGLSLHQGFQYMRIHWGDLRSLKLYVVFVVLLDTLHTCIIMYICYLKLVSDYFRPQYLTLSVWSLNVLTLLTGASIISCQSFFAYRVYRVGRKCRILVAFCMMLLLAELAFCIVGTVKAFGTTQYSEFEQFAWMISSGLGIAVVVDTVLAAVLIYVLHTSRTGLKKTNSMLDTLIAYAVCTGLLTDIFNILGFIFALWSSNTLIYAALNIEVAKIYTNSVLAALNFRRPREPVTATYDIRDFSDLQVAQMGSSTTSGSYGNVYQAKSAPRPGVSAFGPLNSVIEINVPSHFYQEYQERTRTETTAHDRGHHGHVRDVETGRKSLDKKEHEQVYTAY